ncbi:hypothetical protein SDC9_150194 [bioreactor metagenome]|uniref:Uncharacterized protein n=1 Tax=bioreactor metagenome TaxID=1076179 RepID=A0A645ER16_9ZZZZ|nr:hypothetical protein [Candidatus Metalachnospira sp.]
MLIIILLELFLTIIMAIANLKIRDKNKIITVQYLLNFIYIFSLSIAPYLIRLGKLGNVFVFLKAVVLITSFQFYATDFIRYMKDLDNTKDDTQSAKKIMKKALLNHLVFIGLYLIVLYFEYKNI